MMIVARWLKERAPADGRIIPINGARLEPASLLPYPHFYTSARLKGTAAVSAEGIRPTAQGRAH
jgi:hypothetical protein